MTRSQPWDRLPGESAKAYEAFCVYRDLGVDRSIRDAAQKLSKSVMVIARWSGQWDWVNRVREWDIHIEEEARKATEKAEINAIRAMNQRQLKTVQSMQDLYTVRIDKLIREVKAWQARGSPSDDTCPFNTMSERDLLAMYHAGFEKERTILGEASNITGIEEQQPKHRKIIIYGCKSPTDTTGDTGNGAQNEPELKESPGLI